MRNKINTRQERLLRLIEETPFLGISTLREMLGEYVSVPSLNRDFAELVAKGSLVRQGKGRATVYVVSPSYLLHKLIDTKAYFQIEADQRKVIKQFNLQIFDLLRDCEVFNHEEITFLEDLTTSYRKRLEGYPPTLLEKEFERLTIELSWKSSQIEGNTYDLLDTERLLRFKVESEKHTKAEALMLLNHKVAIEYANAYPDLFISLKIKDIEDIHSLLTKELGIQKSIRTRLVGITGTQYRPPDNEYRIREYLVEMCTLINQKSSVFEKAFLAILLISYIQPFEDGNKRTARIVGNGILMGDGNCPLSYRSVDVVDYKKAMLLFYEQNNLRAFKDIFISQYEFAVNNYFL
jgi:fido (protein-threonine AMPylation protein)